MQSLKYRLFSSVVAMVLVYFSMAYGFTASLMNLVFIYSAGKAAETLFYIFKNEDDDLERKQKEYEKRTSRSSK